MYAKYRYFTVRNGYQIYEEIYKKNYMKRIKNNSIYFNNINNYDKT